MRGGSADTLHRILLGLRSLITLGPSALGHQTAGGAKQAVQVKTVMFRSSALHTRPCGSAPSLVLPARVLQGYSVPVPLGLAPLGFSERRQYQSTVCSASNATVNASYSIATANRPQKGSKEATQPVPTGPDDIANVPFAHQQKDNLERHGIFSASDLYRAYQRERGNFRQFLQGTVRVQTEDHLQGMVSFCQCVEMAASLGVSQNQQQRHAEQAGATSPGLEAPAAVGRTCDQVTLSVEGNISAGKSTFLNILNRHLLTDSGFSFVKEPIEQWQSVGGGPVNLLELFYRDPTRLAYTFQNYVFLTRVLQERETYGLTAKARILERSIFSDRMVFVRAVHASKDLADHELAIYDAWFGPILSSLPTLVPNGLIYLRASPEVCMARLLRRARSEESSIPLDYLKSLHDNHEDWLREACTPAATLKQQLQQQQQQQQAGAEQPQGHAAPSSEAELRSGGETSTSSSSVASSAQQQQLQARRGAAAAAPLRPLSEAPPPALALVDIPPSIAGHLYIIDATKVRGVPSSAFLHQLPALVVDCEADVDVDADVAHGQAVSTLIRDYTTFVAAYRAACHSLAAAGHPAAAGLRLPASNSDYYTTDAAGRISYRTITTDVPGVPTPVP